MSEDFRVWRISLLQAPVLDAIFSNIAYCAPRSRLELHSNTKSPKIMQKILTIAQIIVSILLMVSILMQNRGAGLSSTFGGDFGGYYTKRGFEKFLFWSAVVLGALFVALSFAIFYLSTQAI